MPGTETADYVWPMFLGGMGVILLLTLIFALRRRILAHRHISRREMIRQEEEGKRTAIEVACLLICAGAIVLAFTVSISAGIAFASVSGLLLLLVIFWFSTHGPGGKGSDWFSGHTTGSGLPR
jgi:hypothetical protein